MKDASDNLYIASTAYDQSNNTSFIEIVKLSPTDVLLAKLDIHPSIGQHLQVFHINHGHNNNFCLTGLVEKQGRNHVYVAIISPSLSLLNEAYYEYPTADPYGHLHSQGHFILPVSNPEGDAYLIGGMATDGYNYDTTEMHDSKRGLILWMNSNLDPLMSAWLNSNYDCDWTINPTTPYLAPLIFQECDTSPNPTDDYDQIDHIVEYAPMKFLLTGSVNVPKYSTGTGKNFDQGVLVYGINLGCGASNPTALCIGYEFNLSFTTGLAGTIDEDENAVEAIYYPAKDELCVLANTGQHHGLVLANFADISLSSRHLTHGVAIGSFPNPFTFPAASSMKIAESASSNVPDGVMIGGQFKRVDYTFPSDFPGTYNHAFPFLMHVDRKDFTKQNFMKTYAVRSHNFETHFPNNMNHLFARSIENAPFTFTPSNLLATTNLQGNTSSTLLYYSIPQGPNLSQVSKLRANNSGWVECPDNFVLNPSVYFTDDFFHTSKIEQQMSGILKHPIESPTESETPVIDPCFAE